MKMNNSVFGTITGKRYHRQWSTEICSGPRPRDL